MTPIVEMKGISKRFATVVANEGVNFDLYPGETHALVGENGAGKTTLMRILYGQYTPDEGSILVEGEPRNYGVVGAMKLGIGMVHQNFMQVEEMSIVENAMMASTPTRAGFIDYKSARKKVAELLLRFGMKMSPDVPIGSLCVGERQKIEIIKALYLGARVLILDEPTAVLTPQETTELFSIVRELNKEGTSVIFISHKLREVVEIGDRISIMRKGRMVSTHKRGEIDDTGIAREMIGKQDVTLLKNESSHPVGEDVVCEVRGLWYFDGAGIARVENFSMQVHEGEILGIGGVEGNGQTELVDLLVGMQAPSGGSIAMGGEDITRCSIKGRRERGLGFVSEDRLRIGLTLKGTLSENLLCGQEDHKQFSNWIMLDGRAIAQNTNEMTDEFDIRGVGVAGDISGMSGGNLQKIVLAREIGRKPKLLIAAQPTRGLDIGAINFVRQLLLEQKQQGTAVILISADLEELMSLSDRMIIMYEGKCSGEVTDVANTTEESIGLLMGGITHSERQEEA